MSDDETKQCPFCAETIRSEAKICRFCHVDFATGKLITSTQGPLTPPSEVNAHSSVADGVKIGFGMFIVLPILIIVGLLLAVFMFGGFGSHSSPSSSPSYDATSPCAHMDVGSSVRQWCEDEEKKKHAPEDNSAATKYREDDEAAMQKTSELAAWQYNRQMDAISGKEVLTATTRSLNTLKLSTSFAGQQRAQLQFRQHPRWGLDAILSLERGQFLCGMDGCAIEARFDDSPPTSFHGAEPADQSSTALFLQPASRLLALAKKSKRLVLEATISENGAQTFEFDLAGLQWTAESPRAVATVSSARIASEKRCLKDPDYNKRIECLDRAGECFNRFPDSQAANRPALIQCLSAVKP